MSNKRGMGAVGRKRGNVNWGRTMVYTTTPPITYCAFDKIVEGYHLKPMEYEASAPLRDWVRRHRNSHFVPENLLEAWGFQVEA